MKPQIKFGKIEIAYRSETKFLGIHVSEHMDVISPLVIRSVYFVHCHAHLKYGLVFWSGNPKDKTIFKLQKGVVK
jgi:hypothetical protein